MIKSRSELISKGRTTSDRTSSARLACPVTAARRSAVTSKLLTTSADTSTVRAMVRTLLVASGNSNTAALLRKPSVRCVGISRPRVNARAVFLPLRTATSQPSTDGICPAHDLGQGPAHRHKVPLGNQHIRFLAWFRRHVLLLHRAPAGAGDVEYSISAGTEIENVLAITRRRAYCIDLDDLSPEFLVGR